jgi:choline monooxygenase
MEYDIDGWNGLLFTIFDNPSAESSSNFARIREELELRLGWLEVEKFRYDPSRDRDYSIAANWALYVDNYLEGLHIPHVHPDLNQTLDYDLYRTETFPGGVVQVGIAKPGEACFDLPESSPDHGQLIGAYYFWIFPNTMLNFYPWGLSVNIVIPSDIEETRILYRGYVSSVDDLGKGAGGDLDKVEAEDQSIVEAVQKGIKSSAYQRGRYSPSRETGVHHFHRMLVEFDH